MDRNPEKVVGKIQEAVARIGRFSKELVTYGRPTSGQIVSVSLNAIVRQALSFCEHVLEDANATVQFSPEPDVWDVQGVEDQLLQVLINLLTNAAQALPQGGGVVTIRVSNLPAETTWQDANRRGGTMTLGVPSVVRSGAVDAVRLSVTDTGCGISSQDRKRVFEPFFQRSLRVRAVVSGFQSSETSCFPMVGPSRLKASGHGAGTVRRLPVPNSSLPCQRAGRCTGRRFD